MREHPREQPSFLPALSKLRLDVCKFCEESSLRDYSGRAECLNSVVLANWPESSRSEDRVAGTALTASPFGRGLVSKLKLYHGLIRWFWG